MRFTITLCVLLVSLLAERGFAQTTNTAAPRTNNVIALSLEDAIRLALEHNLLLQIERLNPARVEYQLRGDYGYYDPVLNSQVSRQNFTREAGGFNLQTGQPFPPTRSEIDSALNTLSGTLPTGMRYTLTADAGNTTVPDAFLGFTTRTNSDGTPFRDVNVRPGSDTISLSTSIRVEQPLLRDFWIDAGRLLIKMRKRDVQISEHELRRRMMVLVTDVEKAYYDLVAQIENIAVAEVDLQVADRLLSENRRKVEVGTMAPLEEKRALAAVARARTQLVDARNGVGAAEVILKSLMLDNYMSQLGVAVQPTDKLTVLPPLLNLQDSLSRAVQERPDLAQARLRLEQQNIQLKYDFNQLFPSLNVFASWGLNGLDPNFKRAMEDISRRDFQQDGYGVLLRLPLSMWRERANYKVSKILKAQSILDLKNIEETVIREVDDQVREVRSAFERVGLTRDTVAFAEAEFEALQTQLNVGTTTTFFVLEAQSRLTLARFQAIEALRMYNRALSELSLREANTLERRKMELLAE